MPMPLWFGKINKRLFNPGELRRGKRPVIEHVGRTSGKTYLTPLEVLEIDGGYIVVLVYGSGADWVRNVLAAGGGALRIAGSRVDVTDPEVIDAATADSLLDASVKRPPSFLRIREYLRLTSKAS